MKKISFLLAAVLLLSICPTPVSAISSESALTVAEIRETY